MGGQAPGRQEALGRHPGSVSDVSNRTVMILMRAKHVAATLPCGDAPGGTRSFP